MMEGDILNYLQTYPALIVLLPASKIFLGQAPSTAIMPWLVLEIFSGTRTRISKTKLEQRNTIRVTVDCGIANKVAGRNIIEQALQALDFYRGSIYSVKDIYTESGSVGLTVGLNSIHKYNFTSSMRFVETI